MVVSQDILSCPGRARRALLKAKIPPLTVAPKPPREVICRVWLWMAAARGDKVKKAKEEERSVGRNERGLNQCHPLQLSAKKDRCSLCLFVCAWGCMPAQARINQELFCFESISALTNLILDQCKTECNTYWVKFQIKLEIKRASITASNFLLCPLRSWMNATVIVHDRLQHKCSLADLEQRNTVLWMCVYMDVCENRRGPRCRQPSLFIYLQKEKKRKNQTGFGVSRGQGWLHPVQHFFQLLRDSLDLTNQTYICLLLTHNI